MSFDSFATYQFGSCDLYASSSTYDNHLYPSEFLTLEYSEISFLDSPSFSISSSSSVEPSSPSSTASNPDPDVLFDYFSPPGIEDMFTPPTSSTSSPTFTPPAELYREIVTEEEAVSKPEPHASSGSGFASPRDDSEEYEESEGNGTDDEYMPSPVLRPVKTWRGGASRTKRTRSTIRASPYPTSSPISSPLASPSARRRVAPRNVPARTEQLQPDTNDDLQCPHCEHYQHNGRRGDLRRHIKTHFGTQEWVCCGLPTDDEGKILHNGVPHAGGCGWSFSRRDALKRHISNKGCATDLANLRHCRVINA